MKRRQHVEGPETSSRVLWNNEVKYHFSISEFQKTEGGEDIEFSIWHIELLVCEIALTIGSRGRTTTVDFPWKWNTSVSVFRDSAYWNRVDKGTRHSERKILKSRRVKSWNQWQGESRVLVFRVSKVEGARLSTSGFVKSLNPVSRKEKRKFPMSVGCWSRSSCWWMIMRV